jgi:hypothetical protein
LVSWTFYGGIPVGVFIISRWLGSINNAKVSLATFLPAIYSFLTTQWGVASKYPPVCIWVDYPSWKANIWEGRNSNSSHLSESILCVKATTNTF